MQPISPHSTGGERGEKRNLNLNPHAAGFWEWFALTTGNSTHVQAALPCRGQEGHTIPGTTHPSPSSPQQHSVGATKRFGIPPACTRVQQEYFNLENHQPTPSTAEYQQNQRGLRAVVQHRICSAHLPMVPSGSPAIPFTAISCGAQISPTTWFSLARHTRPGADVNQVAVPSPAHRDIEGGPGSASALCNIPGTSLALKCKGRKIC